MGNKPKIDVYILDVLQEYPPQPIDAVEENISWFFDWKLPWKNDWKTVWMSDWKFDWKLPWKNDWKTVWMNDWKFDWKSDWKTVWMNDWKFDWKTVWSSNFLGNLKRDNITYSCFDEKASISLANLLHFLVIRTEDFGGLLCDTLTNRVFCVNDVGCGIIQSLKTGNTIQETAETFTVSTNEIMRIFDFLEENGTHVDWDLLNENCAD